ncbi:glyoxalase [Lacrimispora amygdalina]|uniref:Glyoxalase n=1 Tax=Lacrimispora amygdalina TaxID=253257 RepID=A0A3E2N5G5_9FIRM|nr:VOC family protein [Clostridium indicum]RFZ76131.1 glyoxalase [Clostridium indicum]
MKLKNVLLAVADIEKSKAFYRELFGLGVVTDFGVNVILTEGLVLQEKSAWESGVDSTVHFGGYDGALYFEEYDMERFLNRLEESVYPIEYLNPCFERDWGQKTVRIFDPDRHILEIGEAMSAVIARLLRMGMTPEETAAKTRLPLSVILETWSNGKNV